MIFLIGSPDRKRPKRPWTNGQVERMNRTIKEATVQRFYYESHQQLRHLLDNFVNAYNFARRLAPNATPMATVWQMAQTLLNQLNHGRESGSRL
jgi:transposase InsO family protein